MRECSILISNFLCNIFISSFHSIGWRCTSLDSESRGPIRIWPLPGSFCCVLGQETLLSQCLSPSRLGEWGRQGTCDKHIILPIMTVLFSNDLPLFQPLVFFYNLFPFSKGKDTIICKTTKSWIIWIYFRCETKCCQEKMCCGIEVSLWSYIVTFFRQRHVRQLSFNTKFDLDDLIFRFVNFFSIYGNRVTKPIEWLLRDRQM